jgi:hypothetical protein
MMKKIVLLLILTGFLISCNKKFYPSRTQNFPQVETKVKQLPDKENLWVFILAGQSNMAGRGFVEPQDTIPSERVLTINKAGEIILAKEPLHFYEPTMAGLDCGLSFGKELVEQLPDSVSVLLLPAAVGGSSIQQWLGDSTFRNVQLFSNFGEKVQMGKNYGTIKGILWHQGENDAIKHETIDQYQVRLTELINKFRNTVGDESLPIIIGKLGSFSKNNENWQQINRQIEVYVASDKFASIVETSDLKNKGDLVHFNSKGLRKMGKRFSSTYMELMAK